MARLRNSMAWRAFGVTVALVLATVTITGAAVATCVHEGGVARGASATVCDDGAWVAVDAHGAYPPGNAIVIDHISAGVIARNGVTAIVIDHIGAGVWKAPAGTHADVRDGGVAARGTGSSGAGRVPHVCAAAGTDPVSLAVVDRKDTPAVWAMPCVPFGGASCLASPDLTHVRIVRCSGLP